MAKTKKEKFKVDDFGFSGELDFPEFNFQTAPISDDRTPVTKAAKAFGKGALDTAKSPDFIRRTIKKSMPQGYGEAMDLADQAGGALKDLYDTAAGEIKPVIRDAKRVTRRLLPQMETTLPKSVADKLKKWSQEESQTAYQQLQDQRESSISLVLGDIFKMQTEMGQKEKAERDVQTQMSESFAQKRHLDQIGQLDAMRVSLQQMAGYQQRIESSFQKKSLELQFRSYFVAVDALEEAKRTNATMMAELQGIKKNTGLPEYAKLRSSERFGEIVRNKFIGDMENAFLEKPRNFVRNVGMKLASRVRENVREAAQHMQMGLSAVDMGLDAQELEKQMSELTGEKPSTWKEKAAGMAGSFGAEAVGTRAGRWMRRRMEKNDKVMQGSNKLLYGVQNAPQLAGEWAKTDKMNWLPGVNTLKETILDLLRPDNQVTSDSAGSLQDPDIFTRQANKSVTEVIPGFLSRIYRELKIIRTGDESQKLVSYDYTANRFSDGDSVTQNIYKAVITKASRMNARSNMDALFKELDPDGTKFTPEQRKALTMSLLQDGLQQESANPNRLQDMFSYRGPAAAHGSHFASVFNEHFQDDPRAEKQLRFSQLYHKLGDGIGLSRKTIQDFINSGNRAELERIGLITAGSNSINMDKLLELYLGDEMNYGESQPPTGNVSRRNRMRVNRGPARSQSGHVMADPTEAAQQAPATVQSHITNTDELVKAIRESGTATQGGLDKANETLIRIEALLDRGIVTVDWNGRMDAAGGKIKGWWNRGRDGLRNATESGKRRWRDASMGDMMGGLFRGARGIGQSMWDFGKWTTNKTLSAGKAVLPGIFNAFGYGKDKAIGAGKWFLGKTQEFKDIYIDGEAKPRLHAWALKAGEYRDAATNKVITSYKDIKGAVLDKYGNEIMSAHEAAKAFIKDSPGKKLLKALGAAITFSKDLAGSLLGRLPPAARGVFHAVGATWNFFLSKPQDVYVSGKPQPVLLARIMREGGYFSGITGKPVRHPGQIDGPVLDHERNVVLTEDEFSKGVYDKDGKLIRTGFRNLLRKAGAFAGMGLNVARDLGRRALKVGQFAWQKTKDMADIVWQAGKRAFNIPGSIKSATVKEEMLDPQSLMIKRLTQIRDILDSRLPSKKSIFGDSDGDGDRDNSVKDILQRNKEKLKDKLGAAKEKASGWGTSLMAMLSKLRGGGEDDDDDDSLLDDAADAAEIADYANGDGGRRRRRGGRLRRGMRKAKGLGGKLVSWGGRALGTLGKWGAAGLGAFGLGSAGSAIAGSAAAGTAAATTAATAGGATAAAGATAATAGTAAAGGGLIASILGGIGATIGVIAASPVILGTLAVGAAAGLGYLGYRYLTKKRLTPLSKVRYAQYGFTPDDNDHLQTVFGLEDKLMKSVKFEGTQASLTDQLDTKEILSSFDINPTDEKAVQRWTVWFARRFKPVFLTHLSVLKAIDPSRDLGDVEELKPEEKLKYLNQAKWPSGPYNEWTSPFADQKALIANGSHVEKLVNEAQAAIEKEQKEKKSKPGLMSEAAASTLPASVVAAQKVGFSPEKTGLEVPKDKAGSLPGGQTQPKLSLGGLPVAALGPTVTITGAAVTMQQIGSRSNALDALTALRFKAYGLSRLDADKIAALHLLEREASAGLSYSQGVADWTGSYEALMDSLYGYFGARMGVEFLNWFDYRFMPTFLTFATAVATQTGSTDLFKGVSNLKPEQAYEVGRVIMSAKSRAGSVWSFHISPWPDYELNTSSKSAEANLLALAEPVKQKGGKTIADPTAKAADKPENQPKDGSLGDGNSTMTKEALGQKPASFMESLKDRLSQMWSGTKSVFGQGAGAVAEGVKSWASDTVAGGKQLASDVGKGVSNLFTDGGGEPITHPGKGTGGDINSIPLPKGDGTPEALRELIESAARMVGVDPKMMMTMAAIESGFRTKVKAASSSATGLYQFISDTWRLMLKKYGPKYGIAPNTSPTDPRANALMGAEFIKENYQALKSAVNRPLTTTDLYAAHFLGAGGARRLLQADPSASAVQMMPEAAKSNVGIFYNPDKSPRTVAQVYAHLNSLVQGKGKKFGLVTGAVSDPAATGSSAPAPATLTDAQRGGGNVPGNETIAPVSAAATPSSPESSPTPGLTDKMAGKGYGSSARGSVPSIPVANQQPSVAGMGSLPPSAPAPQRSAAPATDSAAAAAGSGFNPTAARSLQAQQQYQREMSKEAFAPMATTLEQSLTVQRDILTAVGVIRDVINQKKAEGAANAPAAQNSAASQASTRGPATAAPTAPVSMSKGTFI